LRQLITGALVAGAAAVAAVMVFLLLTMAGVGGDMLGWWEGWVRDY
jgi:hypothetical protein